MRILMTFPFSIGVPGGGTYAFLQTAHHLKAAGHDVTVMPLNSSGLKTFIRDKVTEKNDGRQHINALQDAGVHVIPVATNRISFVFDPIYMKKAVSAYIQRHRVDAIISWHHESALLGKLCKENNIFFACRTAGNYEQLAHNRRGTLWSLLASRLVERSLSQANIIWATSKFTRNELINIMGISPSMINVIREGINPIFKRAKPKSRKGERIGRFLFYGTWSRSKGLFDALDAFGQVAAQGITDWEFQVAGWGDKKKVLQSIQKNGLVEQVTLLGELEHPELVKVIEWAQVAILPSYIESFGLSVVENQAGGTPVIAYDSGAIPEIIDDGKTGWLVPLGRTDLLASAIIDAIDNPVKTYNMGIVGQENIGNCFSWPHTVQLMLEDIVRS